MSDIPSAIACKINPDVGTVTWTSEGTEGGKYHSRNFMSPPTHQDLQWDVDTILV